MTKKYAVCGRLIDVDSSDVIENGLVLVEGNTISYAGRAEGMEVPLAFERIDVPHSGAVMPGFIDCHAHLAGVENDDYIGVPRESMLIKAVHDAGELLQSGFTGVRDMSYFGRYLRDGIAKGYIRGPRIVPGGQVLSVTGGHGDLNVNFPVDFVQRDNPIAYLMDGVEGCLKGVRKQFREGAEFIKICATGGVSSMADGVDDVQFSDEEMHVIVQEAKRHGTYVAAHCTGTAGTLQALKAGIGTVEHGVKLNEECIELMVKNDVSLITTLFVSLTVSEMEHLPMWLRDKARNLADYNRKSIDMAHRARINIALGTDFANSGGTLFENIGKEFYYITSCGFTNMEAIKAGTINAAKVLRMADKIGSLKKGKFADLVISAENPVNSIDAIGHRDKILFVMKDGEIEKDTLKCDTKTSI